MMRKYIAVFMGIVLVAAMALGGCQSGGAGASGAPASGTSAPESKPGEPAAGAGTPTPEVPEGWVNAYDGKTGLEPPPTKKDGKIVIAFTPSVMNLHYQLVIAGMKDEIKNLGLEDKVELIIQAPSGETAMDEQIAIVEAWIQQGVDVILSSPVAGSDDALLNAFQRASEAGICVFETNTPAVGSVSPHMVANVGYEQSEAAAMVAQWIVDQAAGKEVKLAIVQGMQGIHASERSKGFNAVIEKHSNIKVVAEDSADAWSVENAMSITENMITANPDIDIIWGQYDEMALGIYTVVNSLGKAGQIQVVGYELLPESYESLMAKEMSASVDNRAKEKGRQCVKAIVEYVINGKDVDKIINYEPIVYDQSNVANFDVKEWEY